MKRLKFEVLVDIEDSAIDSFDTDFGKEELSGVIESELYRYLKDECLGDTNKFKLNIDCADNTVESINKSNSKPEKIVIDWKECSKEVPTNFGACVLVACRNKNKEDGIWLYDLIHCWEGEWEPRENWEDPVKWAYLKNV